jgi:hypothetical protein
MDTTGGSIVEVQMNRRERTLLLGSAVVAGIVCGLEPALAQTASSSGTSAVFTSVQSKATDIFTNARNILMIVGAIGVLAFATMAFFGKFKWSWAVSLLGGLALIAFVGQVVQYFVGTSVNIPTN